MTATVEPRTAPRLALPPERPVAAALQPAPALATAAPPAQIDPLVLRCLAGDARAQQELYRQYAKAMFNLCMRIANDYAEAQDICQEAFVAAFRHMGSFKGESTFGAWLKRIVVNHAVAHMKKKRLALVPLDDKAARRLAAEEPTANEAEVEYKVEAVRRTVQQLPDGYRLVLTLYLFEGYDHAEVAGILGISESTSKSQLNRAKAKLKALLAKQ